VDLLPIDGVSDVKYEDGRLVVTCADPRAKALAIGQLLDANVGVLDVDASSVALEDVFAAYTNGEVDIVHEEDTDDRRGRLSEVLG